MPDEVRIFLDGKDITLWAVGTDTILAGDLEAVMRYRKIDISSFVQTPGLHTLKITCASGIGRVDARVAIT